MRSANGNDYRPTKSPRQSHQSKGHRPFDASGMTLHYQRNMQDAISGDFSVGFPDDFHMVSQTPRRSTDLVK